MLIWTSKYYNIFLSFLCSVSYFQSCREEGESNESLSRMNTGSSSVPARYPNNDNNCNVVCFLCFSVNIITHLLFLSECGDFNCVCVCVCVCGCVCASISLKDNASAYDFYIVFDVSFYFSVLVSVILYVVDLFVLSSFCTRLCVRRSIRGTL